jgi:UDP-N-acetylglucosamine 1-carboxyvinyltransferase
MIHKMQCFEVHIEGGHKLQGTIQISGSKNASFPILAASLLTEEVCWVRNVPQIRDIEVTLSLLESLGSEIQKLKAGTLCLRSLPVGMQKKRALNGDLVQKIRGSVYFLGALLASQGYVEMPFPGGCSWGVRPVDLHLRGFKELGAQVGIQENKITLSAPKGLKGSVLFLGGPAGGSVTGTANILLAAVLAKGCTRIEYAACEPEISELCYLLISMGAHIDGMGSPVLEIEGVDTLKGFSHTISSDRIEAGTWMLIGLCTGHATHPIIAERFPSKELGALLFILREMGANWSLSKDCLQIAGGQSLRATTAHALPYPGFPTDLQAPLAVLMGLARGESAIYDHIYPQRFLYAKELRRMGAQCEMLGGGLKVRESRLQGAEVEVMDLRAGAALYMAGLMAEGVTKVAKVEYVDRGYEHFEEKLNSLGAHVERRAMEIDG